MDDVGKYILFGLIGLGVWWFFLSEDEGWDSEYGKGWVQNNVDLCMDDEETTLLLRQAGIQYNKQLEICTCLANKAKMYESPAAADRAANRLTDDQADELFKDCLNLLY